MKMFLVTFAIEALVILIAVAIIYNVYSALRGIVRMVKRHRDKQKALDKIYRATALFRKMDCHALDFPDATFDLIISRNVVWTLYDPTKAYGEWTRVLKPKGSIVVFDAAWNKEFHNQSWIERMPLGALWAKKRWRNILEIKTCVRNWIKDPFSEMKIDPHGTGLVWKNWGSM